MWRRTGITSGMWTEFGAEQAERDLVVRLHRTKEDTPTNGIVIDATAPLARVVDEILGQAEVMEAHDSDRD